MTEIRSMTLQELEAMFSALSLPKFRAKQVFRWAQQRGAAGFEEMSDLPKPLREQLAQSCALATAKVERRQVSQRDATVKYLFSFADGAAVESVLMDYHYGTSICISTQVGVQNGLHLLRDGPQRL